jgi:septal ring factor EnvC (AmiA/AmiB activator)
MRRALKRDLVTATVALAMLGVMGARAQDRAQTEAQAKRAAERLAALQRESEALATQEKTLLVELRRLEVEREIRVEEQKKIGRDVADVQQKLAEAAARATQLQQEADRQRPDVEARMVQLYKMGRAGYWRLLLDVSSLREVGRAYRTASALARIDRDRVEEHRRTLAALNAERATLQTRARELAALQKKAQAASAAVERAVTARSDLVKSIDERRDLNAQLAGELQDAQLKLQAALANAGSEPAGAPITLPLKAFRGALPWPAEGIVSARFGRQPAHVAGPPIRNGIELSLGEDKPVHAVHEGTVAYADAFSGYGNLVIVDHGSGAYSLYGHLSSMAVKKGDSVAPTTTVGLTGRNPAGNPALYFELRIDGQPVDPLQWLKR